MKKRKKPTSKSNLTQTKRAEIASRLMGNVLETSRPADEYFTVAELKTVMRNGIEETVDLNTALVSPNLVRRIRPSHTHPYVKSTGISHNEKVAYNPAFWLYLSPSLGLKRAEPLAVSWTSDTQTTLQIDQGFLNAFKLMPRITKDELVWDDLSGPVHNVVKNRFLSEYHYPVHSPCYVKIKKSYLEDYLQLRNKVAVLIFTITREVNIDNDVLQLLGNKDSYVEEFEQIEIRIRRFLHKETTAGIEINGYRLLSEPASTSDREEMSEGHYWKGIKGLVTDWRARHEMHIEYVYVSDKVLEKFEADENYQVYPDCGAVSYRNQWSVSCCERVGRNAIKIDIKKLYEGNRHSVIDYWNGFSIHPSEVIDGEHIVAKAERLTRKYFSFGHLLSRLADKIWKLGLTASDIITLDEEAIEYRGWTDFETYKPITDRVDLHFFSKEQFLYRCKKMYNLLGENLKEKSIRKIVGCLGFDEIYTGKLRGLKLLELIFKYLSEARQTGLNPATHKAQISERVNLAQQFLMLSPIFALNDLRQLDAHKAGNSKEKLFNSLETLNIDPGTISGNYSEACYQTYDRLIDMFTEINLFLLNAIDFDHTFEALNISTKP